MVRATSAALVACIALHTAALAPTPQASEPLRACYMRIFTSFYEHQSRISGGRKTRRAKNNQRTAVRGGLYPRD